MDKQKLERLTYLWEEVELCQMARSGEEEFNWGGSELLAQIDELEKLIEELLNELNENKDLT